MNPVFYTAPYLATTIVSTFGGAFLGLKIASESRKAAELASTRINNPSAVAVLNDYNKPVRNATVGAFIGASIVPFSLSELPISQTIFEKGSSLAVAGYEATLPVVNSVIDYCRPTAVATYNAAIPVLRNAYHAAMTVLNNAYHAAPGAIRSFSSRIVAFGRMSYNASAYVGSSIAAHPYIAIAVTVAAVACIARKPIMNSLQRCYNFAVRE